jgi:hypothetical protein
MQKYTKYLTIKQQQSYKYLSDDLDNLLQLQYNKHLTQHIVNDILSIYKSSPHLNIFPLVKKELSGWGRIIKVY